MASFNKVILIGNLTADPELRQTQSGESVCSFSIAVNRRFAKNGECDFINIVAWRQTAEFVTRFFKKGQPILVCGQLQTRSWNDTHGNKRYATEVIADECTFVQNKAETAGSDYPNQSQNQSDGSYVPAAYTTPTSPQFEEIPDDGDLPF